MTSFGKSQEVYGSRTLYREMGTYISRLHQYHKSLMSFDEAVRVNPDDIRTLLLRAKARARTIQFDAAYEDVKKAFTLDPDNITVLTQKSYNAYLMCEFEEGLVQNTRLLPIRQKPQHFKMGIMCCTDAIQNCVGETAGRPLRDYFLTIRKLAWQRNYAAQKSFEPKPRNAPKRKKKIMLSRLLELGQDKEMVNTKNLPSQSYHPDKLCIQESIHSNIMDEDPIPKSQFRTYRHRPIQRHTTNLEHYMAEKYLESMHLDEAFLKQFQFEPGAKSPNKDGTKRVIQIAKNCYKTINLKQEILRTRRPFYFIKYQEGQLTDSLQQRQKYELQQQQMTIVNEADILCNNMLVAYKSKHLKDLLAAVEKLKTYCDSKPLKLFPTKAHYMEEIYDKICGGFYDMYRVNPEHTIDQQTFRIMYVLGMTPSVIRSSSKDSVIDDVQSIFVDTKKRISEMTRRLENTTKCEEACWYYHELAGLEFSLQNFNLSRIYAVKCIKEAQFINNIKWKFNGIMLVLKADMAVHNKNDASNDLALAMTYAAALNDQKKFNYIKLISSIVDELEFDDLLGSKQMEVRENQMIKLMATIDMKEEMAHIFRQMSAMPPSRRMSVIPGTKPDSSGRDLSGKSKKETQNDENINWMEDLTLFS